MPSKSSWVQFPAVSLFRGLAPLEKNPKAARPLSSSCGDACRFRLNCVLRRSSSLDSYSMCIGLASVLPSKPRQPTRAKVLAVRFQWLASSALFLSWYRDTIHHPKTKTHANRMKQEPHPTERSANADNEKHVPCGCRAPLSLVYQGDDSHTHQRQRKRRKRKHKIKAEGTQQSRDQDLAYLKMFKPFPNLKFSGFQ